MKEIEFYCYDDEVWFRDEEGHSDVYAEECQTITEAMYRVIESEYPEAAEALKIAYGRTDDRDYYRYVAVKRFIKCNFSMLDTTYIDIDMLNGRKRMNFEKVNCPMRGECPFEGVICMPLFSSRLTERELTVARHLYEGRRKEEIAELTYLSPETVNNHVRRIYKKLGVHTEAEFVKYVHANHMFEKKK